MHLIIRQKHPDNLESPRSVFDEFLTPNPLFYIRNHFDTPQISRDAWRLSVEGEVHTPLKLNFQDLIAMPAQSVIATIECAGNGRAFLEESTKGVQWELGAVGNAEWTGVPLASVLDRAGVPAHAVDVVLEGADRGSVDEEPKTPGEISYSRSLPISKAREQDVLLAYKMNGQDLSPDHGFPVRAIVPGWFGMASVKWLQRIIVTAQPFGGYFQTIEYSRWNDIDGIPSLVPLGADEVKAVIAAPAPGQSLSANSPFRIYGAAWAGEACVAGVEISVDGGSTWSAATLLDTPAPYCWVRWEYPWQTPEKSTRTKVLARARDTTGLIQPWARDPRDRTYNIHHLLPVAVQIR